MWQCHATLYWSLKAGVWGWREEGRGCVRVCVSLCVFNCVCVHRERGGCLPTIASPPLIVCQGFDEESHCTSFLHDNSSPRTRVCILLFPCFYAHTHSLTQSHSHTHTLTHLFVCSRSFSVLTCFVRPTTWQKEWVGRRRGRKTWPNSKSSLFHRRQPSLVHPPNTHPPCLRRVISSGHTLAVAGAAPVQAVEEQTRECAARHARKIVFFFL